MSLSSQTVSPNLPPDTQREMLRRMLTIRRFEERASADYLAGKIYGVVHCYIGEEAVAVGVCSALGQGDRIISTHRGHGHCIAKGADLNRMMAELYGRQTGYCKGKGGSMHIADFGIGMLEANGIVADGIAIVTSAQGWRRRWKTRAASRSRFRRRRDQCRPVPRAYLNIARSDLEIADAPVMREQHVRREHHDRRDPRSGRWRRAPHRLWRAGRRRRRQRHLRRLSGGEPLLVERARAGDGPSLIECKTYRQRAHTERAGQADSRDRAEIEAWKGRDPIIRLERQLKEQGDLDDAGLAGMEREIIGALEAAVAFAEASPFPLPEQATDDVFAA